MLNAAIPFARLLPQGCVVAPQGKSVLLGDGDGFGSGITASAALPCVERTCDGR